MDSSTRVDNLSTEIDALTIQRDAAVKQAKAIIAKAKAEGRNAPTAQEDAAIDLAIATKNAKDAEIRALEPKLRDAQRALDIERAMRGESFIPTPRKYDEVARVGMEQRTYSRHAERGGVSFLRDMGRDFLYRDPDASLRLQRHMAEERVERAECLTRASNTGNFSGLVVPQYLTDDYAPAIAGMRPFADACRHQDLPPEGMTVNISRITTSSSVGLQSPENSTVANQDMDDTLLSINVQTSAGYGTLSRQALDRGTGIEGVLMDDLFRRYATSIDSTLINQASTGLSAVATANTISSGLTAQTFYSKILGAAAGIETALLGFGRADLAVMSTARWNWYQAQSVSTWPAVQQPNYDPRTWGSANALGYDQGFRGVLPNGLPVIVDASVPTNLGTGTNQDEVYVVPRNECWLWEAPEGAPMFIRAEQPAATSLGVQFVLFGYFAYTFSRYSGAMQKVGGTTFTPPTF